MKKFFLSIFIVNIAFSSLFAQKVTSDLKKMELKGKVKQMIEFEYKHINDTRSSPTKIDSSRIYSYIFDKKGMLSKTTRCSFKQKVKDIYFTDLFKYNQLGNLIEEIFIGSGSNDTSKTIYSYNENDSLSEIIDYGTDGSSNVTQKYSYYENGRLHQIIDFENNQSQNKIKREKIYNENGYIEDDIQYESTNRIRKYSYLYNESGYVIQKNEYNLALEKLLEQTEYIYDDANNIIEQNIFSFNDNGTNSVQKSLYTYNSNNKIIEIKHNIQENGLPTSLSNFEYNSKGYKIKESYRYAQTYTPTNTTTYKTGRETLYVYDEKGNIIEINERDIPGSFSSYQNSKNTKYVYDKYSNWLKYSENGKTYKGRLFEYYE